MRNEYASPKIIMVKIAEADVLTASSPAETPDLDLTKIPNKTSIDF